jgi:hypothetical protein
MVDVRVVATATVVVPVAVSAGSAVQWVLDVALVALVDSAASMEIVLQIAAGK